MHTQKINIAVTYTGTDTKQANYINWITGNDNIETTTLSAEKNNLQQLRIADAVILTGGIDVNPKLYGSIIVDYPNAPASFNDNRDQFEINVVNAALQQGIPILAICRGMQLINCMLGGSLHQDLGEEKNTIHRLVDEGKKHPVFIKPGTLLHNITGKEKDMADSAHHQCIHQLGKGLLINARSEDGLVEGIEWEEKQGQSFLLGVQWHPERMYLQHMQSSALSKNIREYFLKEITTNKAGHPSAI